MASRPCVGRGSFVAARMCWGGGTMSEAKTDRANGRTVTRADLPRSFIVGLAFRARNQRNLSRPSSTKFATPQPPRGGHFGRAARPADPRRRIRRPEHRAAAAAARPRRRPRRSARRRLEGDPGMKTFLDLTDLSDDRLERVLMRLWEGRGWTTSSTAKTLPVEGRLGALLSTIFESRFESVAARVKRRVP